MKAITAMLIIADVISIPGEDGFLSAFHVPQISDAVMAAKIRVVINVIP